MARKKRPPAARLNTQGELVCVHCKADASEIQIVNTGTFFRYVQWVRLVDGKLTLFGDAAVDSSNWDENSDERLWCKACDQNMRIPADWDLQWDDYSANDPANMGGSHPDLIVIDDPAKVTDDIENSPEYKQLLSYSQLAAGVTKLDPHPTEALKALKGIIKIDPIEPHDLTKQIEDALAELADG